MAPTSGRSPGVSDAEEAVMATPPYTGSLVRTPMPALPLPRTVDDWITGTNSAVLLCYSDPNDGTAGPATVRTVRFNPDGSIARIQDVPLPHDIVGVYSWPTLLCEEGGDRYFVMTRPTWGLTDTDMTYFDYITVGETTSTISSSTQTDPVGAGGPSAQLPIMLAVDHVNGRLRGLVSAPLFSQFHFASAAFGSHGVDFNPVPTDPEANFGTPTQVVTADGWMLWSSAYSSNPEAPSDYDGIRATLVQGDGEAILNIIPATSVSPADWPFVVNVNGQRGFPWSRPGRVIVTFLDLTGTIRWLELRADIVTMTTVDLLPAAPSWEDPGLQRPAALIDAAFAEPGSDPEMVTVTDLRLPRSADQMFTDLYSVWEAMYQSLFPTFTEFEALVLEAYGSPQPLLDAANAVGVQSLIVQGADPTDAGIEHVLELPLGTEFAGRFAGHYSTGPVWIDSGNNSVWTLSTLVAPDIESDFNGARVRFT